jgi:hypothetical protein
VRDGDELGGADVFGGAVFGDALVLGDGFTDADVGFSPVVALSESMNKPTSNPVISVSKGPERFM